MVIGGENINGFEKQRRLAGYTQEKLAEVMQVAQCTVSQWENGKAYPTGKKLVALSKLYGCTIDQLFEGKEETA